MKLLIPFLILFFSFCNVKKEQNQSQPVSDKMETEMLLLKLYWSEGEVTIHRNNESIPAQPDLELEKDDLIKTGANGKAELLLGIDHYIKLGSLSEISVSNLLTTNGETISNISLKAGKVLVVVKKESNEEISIQTPNLISNTKDSIVLAQIIPDNKKQKGTACDKNTCLTKLSVLNGNLKLKIPGNQAELLLEKKSQITVGNETELSPNKILPLDRNSTFEVKNLLTSFNAPEPVIDATVLEEFKADPVIVKKPVAIINTKITQNKKPVLPAKKVLPQKSLAIKKPVTQKKPLTKDIHRDRLKLEPNKKF